MAEVYRATDSRLGRAVALKILPEAFAAHPDRMARLAREAQLLTALNYPNIAAIYGLEESGGVPALGMEPTSGGAACRAFEHHSSAGTVRSAGVCVYAISRPALLNHAGESLGMRR